MGEKPFEPRDDPTLLDIILLFIAPTILLALVFVYPDSTQILEYKARNPTIVTVIGSNLAHRGLGHIAGNIFGLWLIGGVGFVFACAIERKRLYYFSFGSYLVILPFFTDPFIRSLLEKSPEVLANFESVGFSQIVGALVGFLALMVGLFAHENIDQTIRGLIVSIAIFFSGFSIIFINFGTSTLALGSSALLGVGAIGYIHWQGSKSIKTPLHLSKEIQFVMAALIIFYSALLLLFPKSVGGGFYGHLAGYIWGYILPAFGIFAIQTLNRSKNIIESQLQ